MAGILRSLRENVQVFYVYALIINVLAFVSRPVSPGKRQKSSLFIGCHVSFKGYSMLVWPVSLRNRQVRLLINSHQLPEPSMHKKTRRGGFLLA